MQRINRRARNGPSTASTASNQTEQAPKADTVTALVRGLAVLQSVGQGGAPSNSEIAEATQLPKATVARLTSTLLQLGYVVEGKGGRGYEIGSQAMALGYSYLAQHDICELAQPVLRQLADRFPCACSLVTREELEVVYLAQARSLSARLMINVSVGSRLRLAETAGGWALTAASRSEERTGLMNYLRQGNPRGWPKSKAHMEAAKEEVDARGFCAALDVDRSGIHAVSTPLRSKGQVYAITCAAPTALVSKDFMLTEVGPELVQLKLALQQRLP